MFGKPAAKLLLAFCSSLIFTMTTFLIVPRLDSDSPLFHEQWDHHAYRVMALEGGSSSSVGTPFGYRILGPWLASLLPVDVEPAFMLIAIFSVALTGTTCFVIAVARGHSNEIGCAAVLIYHGMGWATAFNLGDFWLTDPLLHLFGALAVVAILKRNHVLFAFALGIGTLAKEAMLLFIPLYFISNAKAVLDWNTMGRTAAVSMPALVAAALVRLTITVPGTPGDFYSIAFREGLERVRDVGPELASVFVLGTFGAVPLFLALVGAMQDRRFGLATAALVIGSFAQYLLAVNTFRLFVMAFPAVLVLALDGIKAMSIRTPTTTMFWAFVALLELLGLWYQSWYLPSTTLASHLILHFEVTIFFLALVLWPALSHLGKYLWGRFPEGRGSR